jgi:hypothetical protein
MQHAAAEAASFSPAAGASFRSTAASCQAGLDKLSGGCVKYGMEEEALLNTWRQHKVPFKMPNKQGVVDKVLVPRMKQASMQYALGHMAASMQEVHRLGQQQQQQQQLAAAPAAGSKVRRWAAKVPSCKERQQQVLGDAVRFVFKVHQFAGGLSEAAGTVFRQLAAMLQQVEQGTFVADADAAAAALQLLLVG